MEKNTKKYKKMYTNAAYYWSMYQVRKDYFTQNLWDSSYAGLS